MEVAPCPQKLVYSRVRVWTSKWSLFVQNFPEHSGRFQQLCGLWYLVAYLKAMFRDVNPRFTQFCVANGEVKSPDSWSVYVNQSQLCWVTELQHWVEMKTMMFSAWWEIIAATWEGSSFRHAFISRPLLIVVTVVTERQSGSAEER